MTSGVVTRRLAVIGRLDTGQRVTFNRMGVVLDGVRALVWERFCGAKTAHLSRREVRDRLMAQRCADGFAVPQRLWRATVEDTVDKIGAGQQAELSGAVQRKIYVRAGDDEQERKRLLRLAKCGDWLRDAWLARQCRKVFAGKRPKPKRSGRIVADNLSDDVQRDTTGRVWLTVMTAVRGQRLRLNLGTLPNL